MYPSNRLLWKYDGEMNKWREPRKTGNVREREREAANNVWMEAVEVQQVTGYRWTVSWRGEAHGVEI